MLVSCTTAGRDACALSWTRIPCSDYLLFSHLRAVQQTSLLLAFRKGTIFDARWSAYRIVPYTGLCYKYAYVCLPMQFACLLGTRISSLCLGLIPWVANDSDGDGGFLIVLRLGCSVSGSQAQVWIDCPTDEEKERRGRGRHGRRRSPAGPRARAG